MIFLNSLTGEVALNPAGFVALLRAAVMLMLTNPPA